MFLTHSLLSHILSNYVTNDSCFIVIAHMEMWPSNYHQFTLVTRRPYCPGRPKELCFTTLSLAMETMGMRLSVVKQSFFGPPGQYDRLVTRAKWNLQFKWSGNCFVRTHLFRLRTISLTWPAVISTHRWNKLERPRCGECLTVQCQNIQIS